MAGRDPDDYDDEIPSPEPWYNRTPEVIGASVAGLAVIGILIAAVTFVSRQVNEPEQAPLNFVEPSFSATATGSSPTPTSTSPPVTSDIDGPSSTTSSSPETSSSTDTSPRTAWTKPYTRPSGNEPTPTTRRGPRTNVTRTLYPQP
jgi:cytoskeletal protein RodZ